MNWRQSTIVILICLTFCLVVWDVLAEWRGGDSSTISIVLTSAAKAYPIVPFALGILMGHLFASESGK